MNLLDQFPCRQIRLRNHRLGRAFPPLSKLPCVSQRKPRGIVASKAWTAASTSGRNDETTNPSWADDDATPPAHDAPSRTPSTQYQGTPAAKIAAEHLPAWQEQSSRIRLLDFHPADGSIVADHSRTVAESRTSNSNPSQPCRKQARTKPNYFRNVAGSPRSAMPRRKGHGSCQFPVLSSQQSRPWPLNSELRRELGTGFQSRSKSRIGLPVSGVSLAS